MTTTGRKTGNYYYGARYYDPKVSVWLSVDPWVNRYPYVTPYNFVENNPIMLVDPTGLGPWQPNGDGTWTAESGDGAETLAQDAGISREDAYRIMEEQGHGTYVDPQDGVTKSAVGPGDIVRVSDVPQVSSPKLFEPLPLDQDIYQNLMRGLKYIYHYDRGTLADYEMARWEGRELMMSDVWDFSTATSDVGWQRGGYMAGDGVIHGQFDGGAVKVMLQNTANTGHLQVDPKNFGMIRVIQTENNGLGTSNPDRTIGRINYRSEYQLKRARKYIYNER